MSQDTRLHPGSAGPGYRNAKGEDPLAELARLIGQGDPFAEAPRRAPPVAVEPQRADYIDPRNLFSVDDRADDPRYVAEVEAPAFVPPDEWATERQEPAFSESRHPDAAYHGYDRHEQAAYEEPYDDRWEEQQDPAPPVRHAASTMPPPPVAHEFDDEPVTRRRGGLLTVVSVLGLAVLGTAGAFAYRSMSGPSEVKVPPVIKADTQPNKIAPTQPASPQGDVVSTAPVPKAGERLVAREEAPVNVTEVARANQPRVILQGAPVVTPSAAPPPGSASGPAPAFREPPAPAARTQAPPTQPAARPAPPVTTADQPRPVRTVTVRPDGTTAPTQPAVRAPVAPASSAPLALTPGTAPAQPTQTASLPPAASAGSFVVQVTSQRSETEAQAAFRTLQQRHSTLASYRPIIRRADLGERGTFYRASVGPFASRDEANQMCVNLKAQGGDCVVQRN